MSKFKNQRAFTLAEVLITIGIIGVVASITIPILVQNMNDEAFKVAYKRAYLDISQAFMQAIQENNLEPRTGVGDTKATASEWTVIQGAFKTSKVCSVTTIYDCWVDADRVCIGCGGGAGKPKNDTTSNSFVDASGRSWAQYSIQENIYLVDTNGFKPPNKFGKDRWMFTLKNADNSRVSTGLPVKVGIAFPNDILNSADPNSTYWCQYPPCYYRSWLYNIGQ